MARKVKKVLNIMKLLDTGRCPITPTDINCRGCDYCNYYTELVEDGLRWMVCLWGYTYENIGYHSSDFDGLFMSLGLYKYIDSQGYTGYTYPNSPTYYPEEIPVGAKCRAQECIGVNHKGNFKISVDGGINNETLKYVDADIVVSGSYVCMSNDYEQAIRNLRGY